jgi:signal peptidase I
MPRNTTPLDPSRTAPPRRLALLLAAGTLLITGAAAAPVRLGLVTGDSMTPTLNPGQPFLYVPRKADMPPPPRGSVVLVRLAGQICVKRILALGGEGFWTIGPPAEPRAQCRLLAVGQSPKPWQRRFPSLHFARVQVPRGEVYVVGDSPSSADSRVLGSVPTGNILGEVLLPNGGETLSDGSQVAWSDPPPLPHKG